MYGNDIDDLKVAIKEKNQNDFAGLMLIWRVNADQTISKEILNDELEDPAKTIGETFLGVQVVVRAFDTGNW
ncbi:hypothetical protein RhiirC2_220937 [Rhizophagus irregularis]|uniref:Uncharacterized protein n=1 Tax=Rhizophagus irregularis TaxID=588596 RepID=A0A2N1MI19_9GLOM|nr:hypothetical protein RhiirC2_220937 [Rhizophagus irregularis]